MSGAYRALAPAKVNLGLFLGPVRPADGRHELVSVMQSISLADELTLERAPAGASADRLHCPGVPGASDQNLAMRALRLFRERSGWDAPPLLLSIAKRIPLAAGLAGGSADAAAALRLAAASSGIDDPPLLDELAAELGADVPAQVRPGRWLARAAGEALRELPAPRERFAVLVLALDAELSTASVYAAADDMQSPRPAAELDRLADELAKELAEGAPLPPERLLANDLQPAALSLCPPIADALAQVRSAGAAHALVSGSGPTVLGLFAPPHAERAAEQAASRLRERSPRPLVAHPVDARFARVIPANDVLVRHNPRNP